MHGRVCRKRSDKASLQWFELRQGQAIDYRIKRAKLERELDEAIAANAVEGIGNYQAIKARPPGEC
jgi:hypothetical protein